jgi:hypothetical protein
MLMKQRMTLATEHEQITPKFAAEALIRPMVDLQPLIAIAELTAIVHSPQMDDAATKPLLGTQVLRVGHRSQFSNPGL